MALLWRRRAGQLSRSGGPVARFARRTRVPDCEPCHHGRVRGKCRREARHLSEQSSAQAGFSTGHLDQHPEFSILVGQFIARWSLAEFALLMPLRRATGMSQETASSLLSSINSAEGKIKAITSVVKNAPFNAAEANGILAALGALSKLCEKRNVVAHHLWAVGHDHNVYTIDYRRPDGAAGRICCWTERDLTDLCNATVAAARDICAASGSTWVTDATVKAMMLTDPSERHAE